MKDLIIFGNSPFSKRLKWYIDNDDPRTVVAFCTEKRYVNSDKFCELPLIDIEKMLTIYSPEKYEILIGVGYSKMNDVRKSIYHLCKKKGYQIASYYHSSALIETKEIGEGNIILEQALLSPFVKLGNGNLIMNNVSIAHDNIIGDFNTFSGMVGVAGDVVIGDNCFFGKGSIIKDGLKIKNYVLIGAAAYLATDAPDYSVVAAQKGVILKNKKSTYFI